MASFRRRLGGLQSDLLDAFFQLERRFFPSALAAWARSLDPGPASERDVGQPAVAFLFAGSLLALHGARFRAPRRRAATFLSAPLAAGRVDELEVLDDHLEL